MFWISHEIILACREDLDDFIAALVKVAENCADLMKSQNPG